MMFLHDRLLMFVYSKAGTVPDELNIQNDEKSRPWSVDT